MMRWRERARGSWTRSREELRQENLMKGMKRGLLKRSSRRWEGMREGLIKHVGRCIRGLCRWGGSMRYQRSSKESWVAAT